MMNIIQLNELTTILFDISKYYSYICKMKHIRSRNYKGQFHGYQEWYWKDTIWLRGKFINGVEIGYEEIHLKCKTNFYIR